MPLKGGKINRIIRGQQSSLRHPPGEKVLNREILRVRRLGPGKILICPITPRMKSGCLPVGNMKEETVRAWVRTRLLEYGYTERPPK